MIALYGDGRQAEALSVFRDFRNAVTEELGIEPDADLQLLHQRILGQDPVSSLLERVNEASRLPQGNEADTTPDDSSGSKAAEPAVPQVEPGGRLFHPQRRGGGYHRFKPSTAVMMAAAFVAGLLLGRPLLGGEARPPAAPDAELIGVEDPLPPVQKTSADGVVRFIGRVGSDAQILSTTSVDVPVENPVTTGDTVIVSLGLTSTSAGAVTVTDSAGNVYTPVGDVVDAYWHRTLIYAAFKAGALKTADRITATYPRSSKYHIAVDEFRGVTGVGASASGSNVYEQNASSFTTSKTPLNCKRGDLFVAAVASNSSGVPPRFSAGWQTLPILKLSSYRLTTAFQYVTDDGKCAATGQTRAQWEAIAVVFHR
ncbi:hypothetical protein GCM10009838_17830 [Catenulispora subtropica]|uniref:Bacterial transcriptional activator domain-containing protein n=2 Tax=Catenulispora subtropica TaxID=450798 RepID=A0ABN2R0Z1_9ACTN